MNKKEQLRKKLEGMGGGDFYRIFGRKRMMNEITQKQYNDFFELWRDVNEVVIKEPKQYNKPPRVRIKIKEPIWSKNAVGVAREKMIYNHLEVEIIWTDKEGNRKYPNPFFIRRSDAIKCPTMDIKGHVIHIIPIDKMDEMLTISEQMF